MKNIWMPLTAALLSSAFSAEAKSCNFTEAEGFKPGWLNNQNGWVAESTKVSPQGNGFVELAKEPWKTGYFSEAIPTKETQTYTISAVFSFSEAAETGNNDIISFIFNHKMSNKDTARCYISRATGGGYKIGIKGNKNSSIDSPVFAADTLGFSKTNRDSAPLKITYSLIKGTSHENWTVELVLENLSTGQKVTSLVKADLATAPELFDAAEVYAGFSSSRAEEVSGTANRRIHSLEIQDIPTEKTLSFLLSAL